MAKLFILSYSDAVSFRDIRGHLGVPVSPALYHGIFMLKSNVDTSIELDTIMCAN
jgi:hypothetical protein